MPLPDSSVEATATPPPWLGRAVIALFAALAYFSPLGCGIVPDMALKLYVAAGIALTIYLLCPPIRRRIIDKIALALVTTMPCLAIVDLALRPITRASIYYRPDEMFIHAWPPIPILARYKASVHYEGRCYGDLAAKTGNPAHRQWRDITFITDRNGYRNKPEAPDQMNDVILLGDSFGVGTGTTQDKTLASVLQNRHGHRVYNLSMTSNPYEELINLKAAKGTFRTADQPILLWLIFSGNDLFGAFPDHFDATPQPRHRQWLTSFNTFRNRSPVREFLRRWAYARRPERYKSNVVVKDFLDNQQMLFYEPYLWLKDSRYSEVVGAPTFPGLAATFAEMRRFAESNGWRVAVAVAPTKAEVYPWVARGQPPWTGGARSSGFAQAIREISVTNGFAYLDLQPFLVAQAQPLYEEKKELLWWLDDTHWNEHGQDIAAAAIHERLLQPMREAHSGP